MKKDLELEEEFKKKKKLEDEDDASGGSDAEDDEDEDDGRFVKKGESQKKIEAIAEVKGIIGKLKNFIFPKNNQQRTLDHEVGGLEEEEQKESSEKDVWDDRSEEVDKMGSTNTFNTTGMKSVVWKQKRARLAAKKHAEQGAEAAGVTMATKAKQGGYVDQLKNLRLDRSSINDDRGGGASR